MSIGCIVLYLICIVVVGDQRDRFGFAYLLFEEGEDGDLFRERRDGDVAKALGD